MKRLFDLALSSPAFFLLSFLMLIIAVLVRMRSGSPVLFRQVPDYDTDNVSKKVLRIILSYTDYVNRTRGIWGQAFLIVVV